MESNKINPKTESEWFQKNIAVQEEIYVPINIAKKIELGDTFVAVIIKKDKSNIVFPARCRHRIKKDGNSFRINIPSEHRSTIQGQVLIKIIPLYAPSEIIVEGTEIDLSKFSDAKITEWIDEEFIVLWDNTKHPLIVKRKVDGIQIAKYLGLYYAEGGKSSHYSCTASTKDITKLMLSSYDLIISNKKYSAVICYRKLVHENEQIAKERIKEYWKDMDQNIAINIHGDKTTNLWSGEFGEYRIDDSRILSLRLHLWLIDEILRIGENSRNILEQFLIGGALGDGGVSNRRKESFQHLFISSNKKEYKVWEKVCTLLQIPYKLRLLQDKNSAYILVYNYFAVFDLYTKGLFTEYPKRRKKLAIGLKNRVETKKIHQIQIYLNPKEEGFTNKILKPLEVD